MEKLIKFFPFMPEEKDGGKLALAILFYVFVPSIAATILSAILGVTIILLPLSAVVGVVAFAYTVGGIVFSIMSFTGHELFKKNDDIQE